MEYRYKDGWKEIDKIHGRMSKKIFSIPRFAANVVAGRDSRRSKVMSTLLKY
jgi:hypothetical protein